MAFFLIFPSFIQKKIVILQPKKKTNAFLAGCSAVGSALRSGRRGRQFESGHPDKMRKVYPPVAASRASGGFFLPRHATVLPYI